MPPAKAEAPAAAGPEEAVAAVPGGRRAFLGNGIEVLLLPDEASRVATSIVVLRSGAAWESARTCGASHFLEHMLFNGTETRTQEQLYAETDFYGAFNNATTRRTHVAFMMTLPRRFLGRGLALQADMLLRSTLPEEKFEKERGIILEELVKDRESGRYELERLLAAETYPASSYGLPVLGTEASIAALTRDEVLEFYRRNYVPEKMQIVLLGGFDAAALDSLEAHFGGARPAGEWAPPPPAPVGLGDSRTARHALPLALPRIRLVWEAVAAGSPDRLATEAAAAMLLESESAPAAREVAEHFPGAILGWHCRIEGGAGFGRLILDIDASPGSPLEAIAQAAREAARRPRGIDDAALSAWRTSQKAALLTARQRSTMFAPLYAETVALEGNWGLQTLAERVDALALTQVREAAERLAQGPCWTILVAALRSGGAEPRAAAMGGARPLPPAAPAEAAGGTPPAAGAVMLPPEPPPYTVADTVLAGGTRVLLLDTPPSGVLALYILIEGRNYLEPEGRFGITEFLHLLMGSATARRDEAEFARALQALGGELQTADLAFLPFDDRYTRRDFSFVRFQCLEEHAAGAFALLGEMLAEPPLDPALVARTRAQLLGRLRREARLSRVRAEALLAEAIHGTGHPAARSPFGDTLSVAAITVEDLAAYHRLLLDPRRIWVAVSTSLPAGRVMPAIAAMLPRPAVDPSPTLGFEPLRHRDWLERRSGPEPLGEERWASLAGRRELALGAERGHVLEAVLLPEEAAANPAAARAAVGLFSSRLGLELREARGLAYSIGAGLERAGGRWICVAGAGTRAVQVEAMAAGFKEVRAALGGAGDGSGPPLDAVRREAHAAYGSDLRRQESRLNQAMEAVWSARETGDPLAWWNESSRLPAVASEDVGRLLEALSRVPAERTIEILVR